VTIQSLLRIPELFPVRAGPCRVVLSWVPPMT
jgi:hypothetical protein